MHCKSVIAFPEKNKLSFCETVRLALNEVIGAYGIEVMCEDEPNTIISARLGSPLLIGIGEDEYFIGSDLVYHI